MRRRPLAPGLPRAGRAESRVDAGQRRPRHGAARAPARGRRRRRLPCLPHAGLVHRALPARHRADGGDLRTEAHGRAARDAGRARVSGDPGLARDWVPLHAVNVATQAKLWYWQRISAMLLAAFVVVHLVTLVYAVRGGLTGCRDPRAHARQRRRSAVLRRLRARRRRARTDRRRARRRGVARPGPARELASSRSCSGSCSSSPACARSTRWSRHDVRASPSARATIRPTGRSCCIACPASRSRRSCRCTSGRWDRRCTATRRSMASCASPQAPLVKAAEWSLVVLLAAHLDRRAAHPGDRVPAVERAAQELDRGDGRHRHRLRPRVRAGAGRMTTSRRRIVDELLASLDTTGPCRAAARRSCARCGSPAVAAQDAWPNRSVRIVVPFAAGGATDVVARALGEGSRPSCGDSRSSSTTAAARAATSAPTSSRSRRRTATRC